MTPTTTVSLPARVAGLTEGRLYVARRLVHVSSCWTAHPDVPFFDGSTRRPDWSLYAVSKRLQVRPSCDQFSRGSQRRGGGAGQEEMCEQYRDAHGLQIVMLRPDHIVDSISGRNRQAALTSSDVLDTQGETGWVRLPAGLLATTHEPVYCT